MTPVVVLLGLMISEAQAQPMVPDGPRWKDLAEGMLTTTDFGTLASYQHVFGGGSDKIVPQIERELTMITTTGRWRDSWTGPTSFDSGILDQLVDVSQWGETHNKKLHGWLPFGSNSRSPQWLRDLHGTLTPGEVETHMQTVVMFHRQ